MTTAVDVVVVGAGGIGRRHLQALARLPAGDRVLAVDPRAEARAAAQHDHDAAGAGADLGVTADLASAVGWARRPPVVVVATTADVRAEVTLEALAELAPAQVVLEKVLFQRVADYAVVGRALAAAGVPAWVNHPRAYSPAWLEVAARLDGAPAWDATVSGRGWGLGCNGLHLVERLLPAGVAPVVDTSGLAPGSVPAKRPGAREVVGVLAAGVGLHRLTLRDRGEPPMPPDIHVEWEDGRLLLQERGDHALLHLADAGTGWRFETTRYDVPFQSRLTDVTVDELRTTGTCALPTYDAVAPQHEAFVAALLAHLHASGETSWRDRCPIT